MSFNLADNALSVCPCALTHIERRMDRPDHTQQDRAVNRMTDQEPTLMLKLSFLAVSDA